MRNTKAKLLRRLTRAAAPLEQTPADIRRVYRGVKAVYRSKPGPARATFTAKLAADSRELALASALAKGTDYHLATAAAESA